MKRHIDTAHQGNAVALNVVTGRISNPIYPSIRRTRGLSSIDPLRASLDNHKGVFNKIESDFYSSPEGEIIEDYCIELLKQAESLDSMFSHLDKNERFDRISSLIMYSLITTDPVFTLNQLVKINRRKLAKKKISDYVNKLITAPLNSQIILPILIKDTEYYKSRISHYNSKLKKKI